jgi:hypothetical protein
VNSVVDTRRIIGKNGGLRRRRNTRGRWPPPPPQKNPRMEYFPNEWSTFQSRYVKKDSSSEINFWFQTIFGDGWHLKKIWQHICPTLRRPICLLKSTFMSKNEQIATFQSKIKPYVPPSIAADT